jgi:hypothetical protein
MLKLPPANARMFAPSDYKIIGKTIRGVARLLEGEEAKKANRLLRKKYGFKYTFSIFIFRVSARGKTLFYEITPKGLSN